MSNNANLCVQIFISSHEWSNRIRGKKKSIPRGSQTVTNPRTSWAPIASRNPKRVNRIKKRIPSSYINTVFAPRVVERFCCSSRQTYLLLNRKFPVVLSYKRTMASQSKTSVHDFVVKDARGSDVDLSIYKGKALLIVNVASQCGLTNSNYTELAKLYEKYKGQGLEILAFPCNQFGAQEPGTNEQILEVACTRLKAEYPIFDKVDVNGDKAAPLYKFLKSSKGGLFGDSIKWNFSKFLVDRNGNVVDRYAPTTSPLSIEKDIKKLLEKN